MMYIDPAEEAVAMNLDVVGSFLQTIKTKSIPVVMFTIFSKCLPNNHSYISIAGIAEHTGFSISTVRRAVGRLCDAGIVAKCSDGDFIINPDVAFRGEQSNGKRVEFSMVSRNISA